MFSSFIKTEIRRNDNHWQKDDTPLIHLVIHVQFVHINKTHDRVVKRLEGVEREIEGPTKGLGGIVKLGRIERIVRAKNKFGVHSGPGNKFGLP